MPVKFGPKGYTSATIRRFQDNRPPDAGLDMGKRATPREERLRAIAVVATVAAVLAAAAYSFRGSQPAPTFVGNGHVVAKDMKTADGHEQPVVAVSVELPNGGRHDVVLECDRETWETVQPGDAVAVTYTVQANNAEISVTSIQPKPKPVEL